MAGGFYSRLAGFVQRRRFAVLGVWLLATVALGWSASTITLKTDITDLLPEGVASGADLRFYLERFGSGDQLFFCLRAPAAGPAGADAGDDDLKAADALEEAAARLSADLTATEMFRSVRYGFTEDEGLALARAAMAHLPALLPDERLEELKRRTAPDAVRSAMRRLRSAASGPLMAGPREALAAADPLGLLSLLPAPGPPAGAPVRIDPGSGLFLSGDARALLLIASPVKPPQDVAFSRDLVARVEAIERRLAAAAPGVAVDHAGGYLFAVQDEARIRHDIAWTSSISMAAIVALFALMLRRAVLLLVLLVPLALSTLWTLGVAAIYPGHLNVVTVAFAAILLGMGDDSLTHLYLRFEEEVGEGRRRAEAVRAALASTGPSILVATLTSGLAFAALSFVRFRGLSELGIIAAIGLVNLLVCTCLLFPCLLSFGPETAGPGAAGPATPGSGTAGAGRAAPPPAAPPRPRRAPLEIPMGPFIAWHRWGLRHRGIVLAATGVVVAAAGLACATLRFSSDIRSLRGADPAADRLERVLAPFGGLPDPVHVVTAGATREEALRSAEALLPACRRLQDEGTIAGFASPATWLPPEATQRARFQAASAIGWDRVARDLRAATAELDLNDAFFAPFLDDLAGYDQWDRVRIDPAAAGAAASPAGTLLAGDAADTALFPAPGRTPSQVLARARAIDPGGFAPPARVASVALVVDDLTAVIEGDFARASLLALGAVLLTAAVAFRTWSRLVLLGVPVLIGCLLMLGGLAVLGIPINLMNLVATPLVFGLGIDFGVYILNRHEEEGRADVPRVLRHTGGAILLTGLTTLAGFGSLLAAGFAGLRSMGWVAVLGIGGCLASSLLVLPLLLPPPASGPASGPAPGPARGPVPGPAPGPGPGRA